MIAVVVLATFHAVSSTVVKTVLTVFMVSIKVLHEGVRADGHASVHSGMYRCQLACSFHELRFACGTTSLDEARFEQ